MDEIDDNSPRMDELDTLWVNGFVGDSINSKSIPEGAIIQGFYSIISWIDPEGNHQWRGYNTIDAPLSSILGLLQMAAHTLMVDNTIERE